MKVMMKPLAVSAGLLALAIALSGCEKISNQAKNIQSDWVGLKRVVEIRACMTGELVKVYEGVVRLNPEDQYGASLLIDGKKLHTNMCYIIREKGIKEQPLVAGGDR
ncbi:hypothetical protein SAMN05443662_0383 [Sulfurivirga caldicuralii]|uniref:Uncharacterized protein n=1 Tax=Sulfurivirga caldicuralii TaxID=364032 RepID=A0A1N6DSL7_9GAMM|nr:hypothetical protein [Sulfurivirga caldicuralii]SIN73684.1 hypothetical protein SAMN05443662_0383 [Sulfurivirga caldicuralii]